MDNHLERQTLIKQGKIIVMIIAIYRCLIALVRLPFFLLDFPTVATTHNMHIIFNIAIAIGLFLKIKIAGYILAVVLVFWELEWIWTVVRGFSFFTSEPEWAEGAEDIIPFSMEFLRTVTVGRGAIFISIAVLVAYSMFCSKSVKEYFATRKQ